ncbi:MAG: helix-turn-helix transcriptional regulator [Lachnospiraceae bacterium]|nr:helix-turn-helix transcriptional regulator [Lachnospiraceae bacterium]
MQVNLGEKIKELRKRDGRKQEDLAKALGVTAQAVSRWEAGGCYPDMNMIPPIANYFHVSIDSLFGYNNDREEKIREYVQKANRFFIENDSNSTDTSEIINYLKKGLEEFPGEPELMRLLAMALQAKGKKESCKPNMYLEEAATLFECLLKDNNNVIFPLLFTYTSMGDYDKAEKKAKEQPKLEVCREILLASVLDNEKGAKYRGEAVLSLLHELEFILSSAIAHNEKLNASKEGIEILLGVRDLYEKVFGENNYGKFHSDLCMLDLSCANIALRIKDHDRVLDFFDSAYAHYTEHLKCLTDAADGSLESEHYDSPLLTEVKGNNIPVVVCRPEYFKSIVDALPQEIKAQLVANPKYVTLYK